MTRICRFGLIALLSTLIYPYDLKGQTSRPQEYQVKAAYLYSFGKFVEWPERPSEVGGTFLLCVLGEDPFGRALDDTVADGLIRARPVSFRRVDQVDDARDCHIVFVAASDDEGLQPTLAALAESHVLTVGDMPEFVERGGMVQFTVQANRVRFAVNLDATESAGLVMSSELLRVATTVVKGQAVP